MVECIPSDLEYWISLCVLLLITHLLFNYGLVLYVSKTFRIVEDSNEDIRRHLSRLEPVSRSNSPEPQFFGKTSPFSIKVLR